MRGKRIRDNNYNPPISPPEIWSVSERLIRNLHRMTNTIVTERKTECINACIFLIVFVFMFTKIHTTILQTYQNETEVTIEMLVCGRRTKKKNYRIKLLRLKSIHAYYILLNINYDKEEYLSAHHLNL